MDEHLCYLDYILDLVLIITMCAPCHLYPGSPGCPPHLTHKVLIILEMKDAIYLFKGFHPQIDSVPLSIQLIASLLDEGNTTSKHHIVVVFAEALAGGADREWWIGQTIQPRYLSCISWSIHLTVTLQGYINMLDQV